MTQSGTQYGSIQKVGRVEDWLRRSCSWQRIFIGHPLTNLIVMGYQFTTGVGLTVGLIWPQIFVMRMTWNDIYKSALLDGSACLLTPIFISWTMKCSASNGLIMTSTLRSAATDVKFAIVHFGKWRLAPDEDSRPACDAWRNSRRATCVEVWHVSQCMAISRDNVCPGWSSHPRYSSWSIADTNTLLAFLNRRCLTII